MGEVYRATDTKLKRQVAIKVLPPAMVADRDRLARFQREAEVLASLNHPNIAAIYGLEESEGITALVMELVEGDDLSQRIARLRAPGASARQAGMPLDEALPIAKQIADALEAAHDQGIIHRDLKPANIKVRHDGTVKVLDFGLAKALAPAGSQDPAYETPAGHARSKDPAYENPAGHAKSKDSAYEHLTQSPTLTTPAHLRQGYGAAGTEAGMILGTAAYMSPEQARGLPVDKRADVWAFGVVLFEMLTGTRLFEGATVSDTLAFVITKNPDWTTLPPTTPAAVRRLLRRCLEKDRKRRMADAADVRLEIEEALTATPTPDGVTAAAMAPPPSGRLGVMAALAVAAVAIIALAVPAVRHLLEKGPPATGSVQFTIPPPENTRFGGPEAGGTGAATQLAVSPDGRYVVFVALGERGAQLWMRPLGAVAAQPLPGTEDATFPFWSPDSRFVAFFAGGKLKKLPVSGGPPVSVCDAGSGRGGTWSRDNVIVFSTGSSLGLQRVSATGGDPVAASVLDAEYGDTAHRWPQFLPDGRHFLYTAVIGTCCPPSKPARIRIGVLDTTDTTSLFEAESSVVYASGHLFFNRNGLLMAKPFDADARRFTGEAFPVAEQLASEGSRYASFSVSDTGVLLYANGLNLNGVRQLTWMDRDGKTLGTVGEPAVYASPRLSPDNRRIAVESISGAQDGSDIWILDADGRQTRLTFDPGADAAPVWSPDGGRIAFQGNRQGVPTLRQRLATGGGDEEELQGGVYTVGAPRAYRPTDWSADGRFLAYTSTQLTGVSQDVFVLPLAGDRKPLPFAQESQNESNAVFSPDGRWIAYEASSYVQADVYVRPFPPASGQFQVSKGGGQQPHWRADGKELFFLAPGGTLMAVPIDTTRGFEVGVPRALFRMGVSRIGIGGMYDVAKDGKRFLVSRPMEEAAAAPITVVVNWPATIQK